jgi:hypothetical protein
MGARAVITDVAVIVSALEAVAFIVIYVRRVDWRDPMGRHIMAFISSLAAVLVLAVIRIFAADAAWFAWTRTVVFLAVPITFGQRLFAVLHPERFSRTAPRKD